MDFRSTSHDNHFVSEYVIVYLIDPTFPITDIFISSFLIRTWTYLPKDQPHDFKENLRLKLEKSVLIFQEFYLFNIDTILYSL